MFLPGNASKQQKLHKSFREPVYGIITHFSGTISTVTRLENSDPIVAGNRFKFANISDFVGGQDSDSAASSLQKTMNPSEKGQQSFTSAAQQTASRHVGDKRSGPGPSQSHSLSSAQSRPQGTEQLRWDARSGRLVVEDDPQASTLVGGTVASRIPDKPVLTEMASAGFFFNF